MVNILFVLTHTHTTDYSRRIVNSPNTDKNPSSLALSNTSSNTRMRDQAKFKRPGRIITELKSMSVDIQHETT